MPTMCVLCECNMCAMDPIQKNKIKLLSTDHQ